MLSPPLAASEGWPCKQDFDRGEPRAIVACSLESVSWSFDLAQSRSQGSSPLTYSFQLARIPRFGSGF